MAHIILNHHQVGSLMTEPLSQTGCETVSDLLIFAVCFQISCRATQYLFQKAIRKKMFDYEIAAVSAAGK